MKKIRITQVKSGIDRPERQKLTLKALGLNKMNASRELLASAQILGMVRAVNHLITVEELEGEDAQLTDTVSEAFPQQSQGELTTPTDDNIELPASFVDTTEDEATEVEPLEREEQAI